MIEIEFNGEIIEFPDDTPDATIKAVLSRAAGTPKASITPATGALRSFASGASMGFADELAGVVSAATGGEYSSARDAYNRELEQYREENPGTALASEIGGGLLTGIPAAAKTGATTLGRAALARYAAASPMGKAGLAGMASAVPGAIAGFGNAEEGNRLGGAAAGGVIGGALGAAALPVGRAVGGIARTVAQPFRWAAEQATMTPTERAVKKIGQALARDGISPDDIAANLQRLGPQAALADAGGENVLGLAEGLAQMPGAQRNAARALVEGRATGAGGRVLNAALENMDVSTASFDDLLLASHDRMRKIGPQYQPILESGKVPMTPKLERMMKAPIMRKALAYANTAVENEIGLGRASAKLRKYFIEEPGGVTIATRTVRELDDAMDAILDAGDESAEALARYDELAAIRKGLVQQQKATGNNALTAELRTETPGTKIEASEPTLQVWDYAKRSLDAIINEGTDPVTGKIIKEEARQAIDAKQQLLSYIDELNPDYKRVRSQYADEKALEASLKLGRSFMREDSEVTARRLAEMDPPEQKMFRNGAARAMYEKIMGAEETHTAFRKFKSSPLMREKVRQVFPTQEGFDNFMSQLEREATFSRTRNVLTGNSRTALRQALQEDAGVPAEVAMDLARGSPVSALSRLLVNKGAASLTDIPESMRSEYARLLLSPTSEAKDEALRLLMQRQPRAPLPPMLPDYAPIGGLYALGANTGAGVSR